MATIRIPTPLRKLTDGKEEVAASGATVGEVIDNLERSYPGIKARICDDSGAVRKFVNIFANDEDIRFLSQPGHAGQGFGRGLDRPGHRRRPVAAARRWMSMARMRKRIYLTFPATLVREPLVCRMYAELRVEFNLRTASVTDEIGIIGLELHGEPDEIDAAIEFFRSRGVRVEPIELDVVAG